jgi:transketolase
VTEILSRVHARNLVRWAEHRPEVVVFSADLTGSTEVDLFRDTYPERFFSMGMTEQNMMSMAGAMAREGIYPFVHTFGVFLYRRALDQIAMSVAYPNVPVRMFGFLPGILTPGGATHQAIDDVAVMRALPNMTVLETGDATDVESVLDVAHAVDGPVYVRMLRGEMPRLFPAGEPMALDRVRVLAEGDDVLLVTSGIATEEALRLGPALRARGIAAGHVHVTTLKPLSDPRLLGMAERARLGVVTMENHTIVGGLGTAVAERLAEAGVGRRLVRLGLRDRFAHGASPRHLMAECGIDAHALGQAVGTLVGRPLAIAEEELLPAREAAVHSTAKAEAL